MRLLLVLLLAVLAGCRAPTPQEATVPPPPPDSTLIVAKPDDAVGLDPADISDAESSQVTRSLYDTLVQYASDSVAIEPALATSWEHSEDGKVWTFKLREGVTFHDGTPFDAQAVVINFERQFKADSEYRFPGNKFVYWGYSWGTPSVIERVEAVDPHTVRFHLSRPMAAFLQNLAMPFFAIASPTALKTHGRDSFKNPVGTGAFRFVEWMPRERIVVEANPDYWGGKPALDRVIFKPVKDSTSRQLQLEKGAVHLITGLLLEDVEALRKNPAVTVVTQPGMNIGFVAIDTQEPPFDDLRVRMAVNHAIDRKALVDSLYHGLAQLADSPLPPAVPYRADLHPLAYDPDQARKLLAEAGHQDGIDTTLWYMTAPRPYLPEPKVIAEAIAAMLGQVGIRAELKAVDWGVYLDEIGRGQHSLALGGWIGDHGDPDNYLFVLFDSENVDLERGGSNVSLYRNPAVDQLLGEAQSTLDEDKRKTLYLEAQKLIHEDAPWVPLVYADQTAAHHPALEGFQLHPTGTLRLDEVRWKR